MTELEIFREIVIWMETKEGNPPLSSDNYSWSMIKVFTDTDAFILVPCDTENVYAIIGHFPGWKYDAPLYLDCIASFQRLIDIEKSNPSIYITVSLLSNAPVIICDYSILRQLTLF